jgi:hypothetical protein
VQIAWEADQRAATTITETLVILCLFVNVQVLYRHLCPGHLPAELAAGLFEVRLAWDWQQPLCLLSNSRLEVELGLLSLVNPGAGAAYSLKRWPSSHHAGCSPQVNPELEGPTLPSKSDEEFRPFVRRLPEFKFW